MPKPLTIAEIHDHLSRLSYRPGWKFEIYQGAYEMTHLVIQAEVENSYRPGETVLLDIHSMVPPITSTDEFERWLLWRLTRIEIHECREWLKRDGKPVADPHADGADQDRRLAV